MSNWATWPEFIEKQRLALEQAAGYLEGLKRQLRALKRRKPRAFEEMVKERVN